MSKTETYLQCRIYYVLLACIFLSTSLSSCRKEDFKDSNLPIISCEGLLTNYDIDERKILADYNQAIILNSNDVLTYIHRGILKANRLNDPQGALADFNRAIALDPNETLAYTYRGILKYYKYKELYDSQEALSDFDRAIDVNPNNVFAYTHRAILKHADLNYPQAALSDYDKAIALSPDCAFTYINRGILKADRLDDQQGAIKDMQKAAIIYRQQGRKKQLNDVINFLHVLGVKE